jgi:hypothetical protein
MRQLHDTLSEAPDPQLWTEQERNLMLALAELCDTGRLSAPLKSRFEADWTLAKQLEILALAGAYQTISYVANLAELPPEPFASRFPWPGRHGRAQGR